MNEAQAREKLTALQAELEERVARTHKHIYSKADAVSANFHEQQVETSNDQLVYTLEEEGKAELQQIAQALARLDAGEYFLCSSCGETIAAQRLQAVPFTTFCIKCA